MDNEDIKRVNDPEDKPSEESEKPKEDLKVFVPGEAEENRETVDYSKIEALVGEKINSVLGDKLEGVILKAFDKLNEKHAKEVEQLKAQLGELGDKLPKTITPKKSTIKGYYDFNENTREFINKSANDDYARAKETLRMVNTVFK